jgi:hypothetical protein
MEFYKEITCQVTYISLQNFLVSKIHILILQFVDNLYETSQFY